MMLSYWPFIGAGATLGALIFIYRGIRVTQLMLTHFEAPPEKSRKVIAILTPTATSPCSLVIKGFIRIIKKYASFDFDIIECDYRANPQEAIQWTNYVIDRKVDMVLSILSIVEPIVRTLDFRRQNIPIIAAGVMHEDNSWLNETFQQAYPITGTTVSLEWEEKISLLKRTLPQVKTVLILFRCTVDDIQSVNLVERNAILTVLRKHHIHAKPHNISNIDNSCDFSDELMKNIDLVIITRSSKLMAHTEKIALEAKKYNVPIFSTIALSIELAFITISNNVEEEIGENSGKQALRVLDHGINPSDIKITNLRSSRNRVTLNLTRAFFHDKKSVIGAVSQLPVPMTLSCK